MKDWICRRIPAWFLCLALLLGLSPVPAEAAADWPENVSISAEGGILMDADSGAVLYGKNIHTAYFPASITKILTALVVIENCSLDEMVTFSYNAVHNVEAGSSSAALDVGDQLTVKDCLYAMVLKSANEAANALAEHTAGSIEAFSEMMNAKAEALGCTDSHFNNPSGLNDPNHYTSAHDMALIAQAAFQNDIFVEIDSTLYYDLPQTKRNKEGLRIYPGHRMLKKNTAQYYPGIIGGKTGYTSLAGNTLVTCAERDGMKLIVVVLNGHQTHYTDTKALLDFGFQNFISVSTADVDTKYASVENDMTIAGLPTTDLSVLQLMSNCKVTLPLNAEYSDVTSTLSYDLPETAPKKAVTQITYEYAGRQIGTTYLMLNEGRSAMDETVAEVTTAAPETQMPEAEAAEAAQMRGMQVEGAQMAGITPSAADAQTADSPQARQFSEDDAEETNGQTHTGFLPTLHIPRVVWVICGVVVVLLIAGGGLIALKIQIEKKEEAERLARYNRRRQRLEDIGMSTAEFDMLLQQKRTAASASSQSVYRRKKKKSSQRKRRKDL